MKIIRKVIVGILDRRPFRPILAMLATLFGRRHGLRIFHDGEFWLYEHDGMALPKSRKFEFYGWDIENLAARVNQFRTETSDYWYHVYSPKPGDTIVDVGAEVGSDTVVFARAVGPSGRVVAIEAVPETYRMLLATIHNNKLTNVVAIGKAVAEGPGEVRISVDMSSQSNFLSTSGQRIESDSLDNMLDAYPRIDFLKMNIEGAERLAVMGMDRTIGKTRYLAIACHDFVADMGEGDEQWFRTKKLVTEYLTERGFSLTTRDHDPREYVRWHVHAVKVD